MQPFSELRLVSLADAPEVVVLGVPWDGGTNVPVGTRLGPNAIRRASQSLRRFDPLSLKAPYDIASIGDAGDLQLENRECSVDLEAISKSISQFADRGIRLVIFGGDHLIALSILRALPNSKTLRIVHIDAHSDTTGISSAGETYSSATPFRRAIEEDLIKAENLLQVGLRGQIRTLDRLTWAKDHRVQMMTADEWFAAGAASRIALIRKFASSGPVYVSLDIDAIDPAFAPGTGARVPGGLSAHDVLSLLRGLRGLDVICCDLVEFAPPRDIDGLTAGLAASLAFEMLMLTAESARAARGANG